MGSVKDLQILKAAKEKELGQGRFIFSDRYSVFDWGEMPDKILHKGAAIALLGAYFFEKLSKSGIPTHYVGVVENDTAKKLPDVSAPSNSIEVEILNVLKPTLSGNTYDYSTYKTPRGGILIPLEVIYRNSLPAGSSVFKRLERGETTFKELGLSEAPKPNQKCVPAILDVSTKLEITDRYMSWGEAQSVAGLSDSELSKLKELTQMINKMITEEFARIGLTNEDGKIELGFTPERELMLVDVFGTLDECRFTYDNIPVSKEIARIYYRNSKWFKDVEEAKKKDRQNWKTICASRPEPLPTELKDAISNIYTSVTNEITGKEWFKGVPPLKEILKTVKKYAG